MMSHSTHNPLPTPYARLSPHIRASFIPTSVDFSSSPDPSAADNNTPDVPPPPDLNIPRCSLLPSELPPHCISYIKNQVAKQKRQEGDKGSHAAIECSVSEPDEYAEERRRLMRLQNSRQEATPVVPPLSFNSVDISALGHSSSDQTGEDVEEHQKIFCSFLIRNALLCTPR